ncbi:MAG: aminoglycoside phosphotransferase family protein [Candidatus Thermoplasmatota archaeon]|nr:aminoglycoside phosphotransferase family protein [Candidatus Thermoplasmatota archaeon]
MMLLFPLNQVKKGLTDSEVRKIYQQLGDLYTKMHSTTFERFGKIVEIDGKFKVETSFDSYRDFFLDLSRSWLHRGVDTPFEDKILELEEWLENRSHIFTDNIEPRLIHSDLSSSNVIVQDSSVRGIIDFDIAKAGNNVFDIYRVYRHFEEEKKSEIAVNGFFETYSIDLPQNYKKQIEFYRTIDPLSYIDCWEQIEESYSEKELEETESFVNESIQKILESSSF